MSLRRPSACVCLPLSCMHDTSRQVIRQSSKGFIYALGAKYLRVHSGDSRVHGSSHQVGEGKSEVVTT